MGRERRACRTATARVARVVRRRARRARTDGVVRIGLNRPYCAAGAPVAGCGVTGHGRVYGSGQVAACRFRHDDQSDPMGRYRP